VTTETEEPEVEDAEVIVEGTETTAPEATEANVNTENAEQ
jgi:hypothetical protein